MGVLEAKSNLSDWYVDLIEVAGGRNFNVGFLKFLETDHSLYFVPLMQYSATQERTRVWSTRPRKARSATLVGPARTTILHFDGRAGGPRGPVRHGGLDSIGRRRARQLAIGLGRRCWGCAMKYRIAGRALAGFMIAAGWAKLFWATFPTFHSQELMSLVRLTCPISLIGANYHFPISVTGALISNVLLYGLVGLALEPLRHLSRRAKSA